jgi:hypothetical protein
VSSALGLGAPLPMIGAGGAAGVEVREVLLEQPAQGEAAGQAAGASLERRVDGAPLLAGETLDRPGAMVRPRAVLLKVAEALGGDLVAATGGGIFTSVATMSDASSPLMSTKPGFDHSTYAWLQDNVPVPGRFRGDQLMVFLNDFCDNALVDYGFGTSFQRGEGTA